MSEIKQHWNTLSQMGCIVTGNMIDVTIHHCHGGSMLHVDGLSNPGWAQKQNDWLTIPIWAKIHTGEFGVDTGMGKIKSVVEWEEAFGRQVDYLDQICQEIGYNVWEKAGVNR